MEDPPELDRYESGHNHHRDHAHASEENDRRGNPEDLIRTQRSIAEASQVILPIVSLVVEIALVVVLVHSCEFYIAIH